jgi:hypothetical protein
MSHHIDEQHLAFLDTLKSATFDHLNRKARDHLLGVHQLLAEWGNAASVCLAGLFHNIYGTEFFKPEAVSLDQRAEVAAVIGAEAEALAYLFCVSKRVSFFSRQDPRSPCVWDELHKTRIVVTPAQLVALVDIEAANLVEQYAIELHAFPAQLQQAVTMIKWMLAQPSVMSPTARRALLALLVRIEHDGQNLVRAPHASTAPAPAQASSAALA